MSEETITGAEWLARTLAASNWHNACVLHRCGAATDTDRDSALSASHACWRTPRRSAALHGGNGYAAAMPGAPASASRSRSARRDLGGRFAGCVVRPQPGDRAFDRARAYRSFIIATRIRKSASAALCVGDEELLGPMSPDTADLPAFAAPGMARGDDGVPAAGTSSICMAVPQTSSRPAW